MENRQTTSKLISVSAPYEYERSAGVRQVIAGTIGNLLSMEKRYYKRNKLDAGRCPVRFNRRQIDWAVKMAKNAGIQMFRIWEADCWKAKSFMMPAIKWNYGVQDFSIANFDNP